MSVEDVTNQWDKDKHTNRNMSRGHKKAIHKKEIQVAKKHVVKLKSQW